jgi:hypothetical protein
MTYRPEPWQVEPPDGQRPVTVQTNVQVPVDASQADVAALMVVAQDIVNNSMTQLQRWLNNNRMQVSTSGQSYAGNRFNMPAMNGRWSINNGYEKLILDVFPTKGGGAPPSSETNLDGYIAMVNTGIEIGSYTPQGVYQGFVQDMTFDLQVNDVSLGTVNMTTNVPGAVIIAFGSTALRCESLADADKANPNQSRVSNILPPRKKIKAFTINSDQFGEEDSEDNRQIPDDFKDVFGYFMYDWNLLLNIHNNPKTFFKINNLPIIQTIKISSDRANQVLKQKGLNKFRAKLTTPFIEHKTGSGFIFVTESEFYSRYYFRPVTQSWTKRADPPSQIIVNDKPLHFATIAITSNVIPLDMDLTPQDEDFTTATPFDAYQPAAEGSPGVAPYINGYWRVGDLQSNANGAPSSPWSIAYPLINQYADMLSGLLQLFDNKYQYDYTDPVTGQTTPPAPEVGVPLPPPSSDDFAYTVTGTFFGEPFGPLITSVATGSIGYEMVDQTTLASYSEVHEIVAGQVGVWLGNQAQADDKAFQFDIFNPDRLSLQMLSQADDDMMTLATKMIGVTKGSFYDTSSSDDEMIAHTPFWGWEQNTPTSEFAGSWAQSFTGPNGAENYEAPAQHLYGLRLLDEAAGTLLSLIAAVPPALQNLSTLLDAMDKKWPSEDN